MGTRGEELNLRVTADTKQAADNVGDLKDDVAQLEDTPHEVDVTADTAAAEKATRQLDERLKDLTDDEKRVVLEVMARNAQRDLDKLNRDLARAESFSDKEIQLRLEAKGNAEQKLKAIRDELTEIGDEADDVDEELSKLGSGLGAKFQGLGAQLGTKLIAGLSAAGIGTALVESIQRSWEQAGGIRQITNEFDLSGREAVRYGRIASRLYADNWGDSLTEVQRNVALTAQRIGAATSGELQGLTRDIMAVSQTWGAEFDAVVRSVTQLVQNGLAPNARAALDVITAGFQQGANEAGDLLETIDEYSQHWAAMGLSAEEAMSILVHGLQNGQRDADKLADAVKEMRIRVVEDNDAISDAYRELGLDADDTRRKFLAGGESASDAYLTVLEALNSVEDPIARNRLAIELIGTQFEDLGPKALDSLMAVEDGLERVEGASKRVSDNIKATPWEELRRDGEASLYGLGNALGWLAGKISEIQNPGRDEGLAAMGLEIDEATGAIVRAGEAVDVLAGMEDKLYSSSRGAASGGRALHESLTEVRDTSGQTADQLERVNSTMERGSGWADVFGGRVLRLAADISEAGQRMATEFSDAIQSVLDRVQAAGDAVRDRLDLEDSLDSIAEQFARINELSDKAGKDGVEGTREYEREIRRLRRQLLALVDDLDHLSQRDKLRFYTEIERGSLDELFGILGDLTKGVTVPVSFSMPNTHKAFTGLNIAVGQAGAPSLVFTPTAQPQQINDYSQTTVFAPITGTPTSQFVDRRRGAQWGIR